MTTPAPWLDRLARTTDYGELQLVFTEIAMEAGRTTDRAGLAAQIDEAILRIERERLQDEDQLRAFEKEHETFKASKRGVVGWFKRHVPFSETRRQDKEHRHAVDDQEAEVLADNMVIARAQMLKEKLLPPEARRLGLGPDGWQRRLAEHDADRTLRAYADDLIALGREVTRGEAFIQEIDGDLEAFARAKFAEKEDRSRRDDDLRAARAELGACRQELDDASALRTRSLARLRDLVASELSSADRSFDELTDRVSRFTAAIERAGKIQEQLHALTAEVESARKLGGALETLPAEKAAKEDETRKLEQQVEDAERARLRTASHAAEKAARLKEARERLARAQDAADTAKHAFDAHLATTGQAEMPSGATFETSSPEAAALARAEKALSKEQGDVHAAEAVHEQAEAEHQDAEHEVTSLRERIDRLRTERAALERDLDHKQRELAKVTSHVEPLLERLPRDLADYRSTLAPLDLSYARADLEAEMLLGRERRVGGFSSHHEAPIDQEEVLARLVRLEGTTKTEHEALVADAEAARNRRDAWLRTRCRELLGDELAGEVCP